MSIYLMIYHPHEVIVVADTLVRFIDSFKPYKLSSKIHVLPHIRSLLFGIGPSDLVWQFYTQLSNRVVAADVSYPASVAQPLLVGIYQSLRRTDPNIPTSIIYLIGWSTVLRRILCFQFDGQNGFEPTTISGETSVVFPQSQTVQKVIETMNKTGKIDISDLLKAWKSDAQEGVCPYGGELQLFRMGDDGDFHISTIKRTEGFQHEFNQVLSVSNKTEVSTPSVSVAYLDQDIWGNLTENWINGDRAKVLELENLVDNGKIVIVFSAFNVQETIRSTDKAAVAIELWLMERLSHRTQVEDSRGLFRQSPFVVKDAFESDQFSDVVDGFTDLTNALITDCGKSSSGFNHLLDKNLLNNLPPDEACSRVWYEMRKLISSVKIEHHEITENMRSRIFQYANDVVDLLWQTVLKDYFPGLSEESGIDLLSELRASFVKVMDKTLSDSHNVDLSEISSLSDMIQTRIPDVRMLPSALVSFLDIAGYWSDPPRLKKRKGPFGDMHDPSHFGLAEQHCSVFVSNDKRLRNRARAVTDHLRSDLRIMAEQDFLTWITTL